MEDNLKHLDEIGGPKLENHYPVGWAQASNTPFQWYKHTTYFGGIRDPLIIHWPAGTGRRGSKTREPCVHSFIT